MPGERANSQSSELMFESAEASWAGGSQPCNGSLLHTAFGKKGTGDASGQLWSGGWGGLPLAGRETGLVGHIGYFCQGSAHNVSLDINKNKFSAPGSGKS